MTRRALAAFVGLVAAVCTYANVGSAQSLAVPRTLADARPASVGVIEPGFPVDVVGAVWDAHGHVDGAQTAAVRFRHGADWGPWVPFAEDGAQAEGQFGTDLVAGSDADAYQVRGVPAGARVVAINTTDGPSREVAELPAGSAGAAAPCRSRADWGADESSMTWTPAFQPVQVVTVHHTATANADPDPAATVRAIYRFHAVDRGWGDIGYQYLVDQQGTVYEGRSSGAASRSCVTDTGDGSDFGHTEDGTDRGVVGAHVDGWNSGNLGVSLLGTYTDVAPPAAQRATLDEIVDRLTDRHGIDPLDTAYLFTNPASGAQRTVPTVSGHRDWEATECPGGVLYEALPDVRAAAAGIRLTAAAYAVRSVRFVDLAWTGAFGATVDILRNGRVIASGVANDGAYTDRLGRRTKSSYAYQVCEPGGRCSPKVVALL
jgi:hypothetical protein